MSLKNKLAWVLVLFTTLSVAGCNRAPHLPDEVSALTLKTLTGEQIVLAELSNPILISFWATDCVICVQEMPELAKLYRQYAPSGFNLVAVAMPYDPPNLVLGMAEREQWPFPVALDVTGVVLKSFASVKGTPTSYLLDANGSLIKRYVGAVPIARLEKKLNALLDIS